MRKDIKKRLEKALITLKEPGGSTIRSIIKVINQEVPILTLRKVLEALQQGINEGFLCMYNGRFKLKQQIICDTKGGVNSEEKDTEEIPEGSDNELPPEDSDWEDEFINRQLENEILGLKFINKKIKNVATKSRGQTKSKSQKKKRSRKTKKKGPPKGRSKNRKSFVRRSEEETGSSSGSLMEMTSGPMSKKPQIARQAAEKLDMKKQRGPRCTSMKKDVRMPSKVHIPFVPPSVPQRSSTFNDLLRRSPEPVNGPLYDNKILLIPENLGFFGTYY